MPHEDEHPVVASMCEGCKFKRDDQIIKPRPTGLRLEQTFSIVVPTAKAGCTGRGVRVSQTEISGMLQD